MFGDSTTQQDQTNGYVQPMDPSLVSDTTAPLPAEDHTMTPAYPVDNQALTQVDDGGLSVQAMHQDAVASSPAGTGVYPADDTSVVAPTASSAPSADDSDLLTIKQDALQALTPLVGTLEQTPEEKFRTTMMMIQASDDRSLVRTAYDAAQAITDEKSKAQALLDVINEINYFTSHTS